MELNNKVLTALNTQVGIEGIAYHFYLNFASYCDLRGYKHSAAFFYNSAKEECAHREMFVKYISERLKIAKVGEIPAANKFPKDLCDCFELSYNKEKDVTAAIEALSFLAWEQNDLITFNFLTWFVNEQRESEDKFNTICDAIKSFGSAPDKDNLIELYIKELK